MIKIVETKRLGIVVYIATIIVENRTIRQSIHMSEGGAKTWVRCELDRLGAQLLKRA